MGMLERPVSDFLSSVLSPVLDPELVAEDAARVAAAQAASSTCQPVRLLMNAGRTHEKLRSSQGGWGLAAGIVEGSTVDGLACT